MNITEARREMFIRMQTVWSATVWPSNLFDFAPTLLFQGRDATKPPAPDVPYAHIYRRSIFGEQAAMSDGSSQPYSDMGTLWILCFGPQSSGKGLEMAEFQATIASNAYRGPNRNSCIWYRNVRTVDVGLKDGLEQINVLVDYEYNETR